MDELSWREQGGSIGHLPIAELAAARIDLRVNRDHGFVPGKGFGVLTLVTVEGEERHVKMEPGSAAEAVLRVVTECSDRKSILSAAKGGKNYVDGYRAVSKAEADDIAKHGFRPDPSGRSMQDKWFSETRQVLDQFRKTYPDLQETVKTRVPRDVYDRSFKPPNIDNTGPGFCVECADLGLLPKP